MTSAVIWMITGFVRLNVVPVAMPVCHIAMGMKVIPLIVISALAALG
jgi:hypothetical protein